MTNTLTQALEVSGDLGGWFELLREDLNQPFFSLLMKEVYKDVKWGIAPHPKYIFRALKLCPPDRTKVILLGQDPYPQPYVADGLAFSTQQINRPVSLMNIIQEAKKWFGKNKTNHEELFYWNELSQWADQGVLLLNAALTCKNNEVGSHMKHWRPFISALLNTQRDKVVVLMGKEAQSFEGTVKRYNSVINCPHPVARNDEFKGCDVFCKINNELKIGINWGLWKEKCVTAGLYAGETLLASLPGNYAMLPETREEIIKLIGLEVQDLAYLEPLAQSCLKRKINPSWMKGADLHLFYHDVLVKAMTLPDGTIISQFKIH
jgi:uracil-DNA glycosylase